MKAVLLVTGLWMLLACKTDDPQAALLPGRWEFVESFYDGYVHKANPQFPGYLVFTGSGKAGDVPESYPINGGWCNETKAYIRTENELRFTFGEPQCIPFVPQQGNEKALVLELTQDNLLIEWKASKIRYKRVR